jgi:spectinomycin phosphotransferase
MREPPTGVSDAAALEAVLMHWSLAADGAAHLPVGFGAHHWCISNLGSPVLFATLDTLEPRHTAESLERAYASAATLAASGLDFVAASSRTVNGHYTAPLAGGLVSVVPWIEGVTADLSAPGADVPLRTAALLDRLHRATAPPDTPVWRPAVDADLSTRLVGLTRRPWGTGPLGEPVRQVLASSLDRVERWTTRHEQLVAQASDHPWVVTHGEPHPQNLIDTASGLVLVDWESIALAPRERDLRVLIEQGHPRPSGIEDGMLELFDLDWRLDEVAQYSTWFSSPHAGSESDAVAYDGLLHELTRPDWAPPT